MVIERRRFGQAVSRNTKRRIVSINAGNITITPHSAAPPPVSPPKKKSLPPLLIPSSTPFSIPTAKPIRPPPPPPPLFSSFADLFKSKTTHHTAQPSQPGIPDHQKGILPLPDHLKLQGPFPRHEPGWTQVINKKKLSRLRHRSLLSAPSGSSFPKPKRCFLCGDLSHMARSCNIGGFKCFACNCIGHTSACCPNKRNPILHSIFPPPSEPPPLFISSITLPDSVIEIMDSYSCFAFFTLLVGNPSLEELIENLEFHLKVDKWIYDIRPTSSSSYFIQFPNEETLDRACSKEFFDMGTFGGAFVPWSEKLGLKPLPKFIYVWVEISNLPLHLWDTEFLMLLLGDIGDVITVSDDVMIKKNAKECKVMLSVRDPSELPRSVTFRYASPDGEHIMEGNIQLKMVGKPLTEKKGKCLEYFEHFVRKEGNSSSSSEGAPHPPPKPQDIPKHHPQLAHTPRAGCSRNPADPKGKGVPSAQAKQPSPQDHTILPPAAQPPVSEDIIEVVFKGVPICIARDSWALLSASFPPSVEDPSPAKIPSHQTPVIPQVISSSSGSMDVASFSDPPPGFEKIKKKQKRKHSSRALGHLPHRKHLALMKRSFPPGSSKGKSVSSSSSIPLNCMSNDFFHVLASNCGVKDPDIPQGLANIQALEKSRAKPTS